MIELEAMPLRGTEGTVMAGGFSPDGRFLLVSDFQPPRMLKRVPATGGQVTPIAEYPDNGATWGPDDTIVLGSFEGLLLLPASGGERTRLTTVRDGEIGHVNPRFLPNGRAVLFLISTGDPGTSEVAVYDLDTGERRTLLQGTAAQFANSGHLIFWRDGSLWAVAFDMDRLETSGTPVVVVQNVEAGTFGYARYAMGTNGTLTFVPAGQSIGAQRTLLWVDRGGNERPLPAGTATLLQPAAVPRRATGGSRRAGPRQQRHPHL